MIRNVSKDDYLLARGANPRTGVVTPTTHSASNSFDEGRILRARGVAPPPKWRQRGDEWISLEFGQPTPLPTPPVGGGPHASQKLRTPQRISSNEHDFFQDTRRDTPSSRPQQKSQAYFQNSIATPVDVRGTYVETPADVNRVAFRQNAGFFHSIPRKPVGTSPAKSGEQLSPRDITGKRHDALNSPSQALNASRSSSAPSPPKSMPFTPADVGKNLPPLPPQEATQIIHNTGTLPSDHPFLGQHKMSQRGDDPESETLRNYGLTLADKQLPCLPTNNGQFQLRQHQRPQIKHHGQVQLEEPVPQARTLGPRGVNLEYPYIRDSRPRIAPSIEMRREPPRAAIPMPLPRYDNPPNYQQKPLRLNHAQVKGPRMMNRSHHRPNDADDVFVIGPSTMSTNTTTYMSMPNRLERQMTRCHPNPNLDASIPRGRAMAINTGTDQPRIAPSTSMNISMNSGNLMATSMPQSRPRASSRPQMLGRADGMRSIPRISPHGTLGLTSTVLPLQWNPTGMTPNVRNASDVQSDQLLPEHQRIPSKIPTRASPGRVIQPPTTSQPVGLIRRCSHCHYGFVKDRQRNTDGVIPISPDRAALSQHNTPQKYSGDHHGSLQTQTCSPLKHVQDETQNKYIVNHVMLGQVDHRDHSGCCPDCCKEQDCHEGCLGHASLAPSPTRSIRSSQDTVGSGNESQGSAKESDAQSNTSEKVRIGRLAFMRSAFKKSFKDKPPAHSRQSSKNVLETKGSSVAELSTRPIDLSTHPVSPGAFWGDNTSAGVSPAAEAAKTAIGLKDKTSTSSDEVLPIPSPLKVKKNRRKKNEGNDNARKLTAPTPVTSETPTLPGPNESRRVASGPSLCVTSPAGILGPRSVSDKGRSGSGASVATIEVQVPALGALGIGALWEMVLVPFEASKMWLRNHPRVTTFTKNVIARGWEMVQVITLTSAKLWGVVFVYSKTGRLKLKKGDTAGGFVFDCMRSALYGLVFMAIGVAVMRVLKWMLNIMGVLGMVINAVIWVFKTLLGYGLFW